MNTSEQIPHTLSLSEIEEELAAYFETLAEPHFTEELRNLISDIYQSNSDLINLDFADLISTLNKPGLSWIKSVEAYPNELSSSLAEIVTEIKAKGLDVKSAKKILVRSELGSDVSSSDFDSFYDQLSKLGSKNIEFAGGIQILAPKHKQDDKQIRYTVLLSGLSNKRLIAI